MALAAKATPRPRPAPEPPPTPLIVTPPLPVEKMEEPDETLMPSWSVAVEAEVDVFVPVILIRPFTAEMTPVLKKTPSATPAAVLPLIVMVPAPAVEIVGPVICMPRLFPLVALALDTPVIEILPVPAVTFARRITPEAPVPAPLAVPFRMMAPEPLLVIAAAALC